MGQPVAEGEEVQAALAREAPTTSVPLADLVEANDSVEVTDSEINVSVLTAQIGDVDSPRKPKDVVLVPEQSFALHTFWGSYYPSSHTPEFIANNQDVLKVSTGQALNDKSFTAIGDWLGIDSVISGPFPYQCDVDEGGWFSDDEHWCGWKDTSGWFSGSTPADASMYHINATKSLSIINGFDYDMDNWRYDTMIRSNGKWMKLPNDWGDYYKEDGIDDYQEDEIYDNADASEFEHTDIPLEDLYYINYNFGADTWGIDTDQANEWVRMEYESLLAEVENVSPLDPFGMRFKAMKDTIEILNGAMGDQVAIIPNGEVANSLSESFVDADLDLDDLDHADKILHDYEIFNATNADDELQQAKEDLGKLRTSVDPVDYAEFNVWDTGAQPGGFSLGINELQTIDESQRDSDKHIVLITGGQQPLRPQDEWYEKLANDILDGIPDFFGWFPDRITEERPDPDQVGHQTDEYVEQIAQIANNNDVTVHTLGLGESHDGFRLATIADEADDDSICLSSIDHPDCNFETVTDAANLDQALLEQIFEDTSQKYTVKRPHTTLTVDVEGGETETLDLSNVNDPNEFRIEEGFDPLTTTFENLTFRDDVAFELTVDTDCSSSSDAPEETWDDFPGNFEVVYDHKECDAGGNPVTVDDNFVFTDGDDLEQLRYTQVAEWTKDPAEVIAEKYPDLVDNGKLDLKDDAAGTNGAIVMLPVDVNPKGYVLLHVRYEQLPEATHFAVEDVGVENSDRAAYEDLDGEETVVHAAGDELTVDFDVTNLAKTGAEVVTLETEGGRVLDHKRRTLGTSQSWPDSTSTFDWTPGEADIGYHGKLIVSSQNDEMESAVNVEIKEPGADLQLKSVTPNGRIYVDLTGEDMEAEERFRMNQVFNFNATILNVGPDKGEDELVSLELAEGASMFTTLTVDEIGAYGWNGTAPGGVPSDTTTVEFDDWDPGFEIVGSWDENGIGAVRIPYEVATDDDRVVRDGEQGLLVVYQVDPATAESQLDDVEDDDFDPIEVDIDEIELEN